MPDLQVEGAVAGAGAALHAQTATDAGGLVDHVLEVRPAEVLAADRIGRAELVLDSGVGLGSSLPSAVRLIDRSFGSITGLLLAGAYSLP